LFTPLLPSTTTGTLEFRSIIEPIRESALLSHGSFYQATCTNIDHEKNVIKCRDYYKDEEFEVNYDKLVIAVGAQNNTYNIPGVPEHALFLKELRDARKIRLRLIECFERAVVPSTSDQERKRLLNCVVVGGGPTGVEFAGELCDFLWRDMPRAYPSIDVSNVRVTLVEAGSTILSSFHQSLVKRAITTLKRQGVDVRTGTIVKSVSKGRLELDNGETIPYGTLIWSTGVGPRPLIQDSSFEKKNGRLVTDQYLRVHGHENIYALGDCAAIEDNILPPTAQVAQQQGKYLADSFNNMISKTPVKPFQYKFLGLMTYVGSSKSLIDSPAIKGSGFIAWLTWRTAYLTKLGSLKNRLQVPFDWLRCLIFGRDVTTF